MNATTIYMEVLGGCRRLELDALSYVLLEGTAAHTGHSASLLSLVLLSLRLVSFVLSLRSSDNSPLRTPGQARVARAAHNLLPL